MKVSLKVWRQKNANAAGEFKTYASPELNPNMSFLEMLDVVNEELSSQGEEPIAFDHDCREGILRYLLAGHRWQAPRSPQGCGHLPDLHAELLQRRSNRH